MNSPISPSIRSWLFFLVAGVLSFSCSAETTSNPEKPESEKLIWQQTSEQGIFDVTLDSNTAGVVAINEFLEWVLIIKDAEGEPVTPVRVSVSGGMPMHGHGLPSQPQVSEYLGDGKYLIKGLQFSMNGRWELAFDIQSKEQTDKVVFEFKIDY